MSFQHRIDRERRLGVLEVTGSVTGRALAEALTAQEDDSDMEALFGRLWDWRGIELLDLDEALDWIQGA